MYGRAREGDTLSEVQVEPLTVAEQPEGQAATFTGTVRLSRAGSFGYTVRVVPKHPMLANSAELGLVAVAH